jgi:hypothetical protein
VGTQNEYDQTLHRHNTSAYVASTNMDGWVQCEQQQKKISIKECLLEIANGAQDSSKERKEKKSKNREEKGWEKIRLNGLTFGSEHSNDLCPRPPQL